MRNDITCRKDLFHAGLVVFRVGFHVGAAIQFQLVARLGDVGVEEGAGEANGGKHKICPQDELGAFDRTALFVNAGAFHTCDHAVLTYESQGRGGKFTLCTFRLRRRGPEFRRPIRPDGHLVFLERRDGADVELRDRERALTECRADAVGRGVTAADDDDMLATGPDRQLVTFRFTTDTAVLLDQVFHRPVAAFQLHAGDARIARTLGGTLEGDALLAVAAKVGMTRLIDNVVLGQDAPPTEDLGES